MRIARIHIEAFGGMRDLTIDGLAEHDVVVIAGRNEAGKSTIRAAVESILYGFDPADGSRHPYAVPDSRIGGSLGLVLGESNLGVERYLRSRPVGRVTRDAGVPTDLANRALPDLDDIPRSLYRALHIFEPDGLLALGQPAMRAIEERLLTGGGSLAGLRSSADVRRELAAEAARLWRPNRRGKSAAALVDAARGDARRAARDRVHDDERIREIETLLADLHAGEQRLRSEERHLRAIRVAHEQLGPAYQWSLLRSEAEALLPERLDAEIPADPRRDLAAADERVADETRRLEASEAVLDRARRESTPNPPDERIVAVSDTLRSLAAADQASPPAAAQAVVDQAALVATLDRRESLLQAGRTWVASIVAATIAAAGLAFALADGANRQAALLVSLFAAICAFLLAAPLLRARRQRRLCDVRLAEILAPVDVSPERLTVANRALADDIADLAGELAAYETAREDLAAARRTSERRQGEAAALLRSLGFTTIADAIAELEAATARTTAARVRLLDLPEARHAVEEAHTGLGRAVAARASLHARLDAVGCATHAEAIKQVELARQRRGDAAAIERSLRQRGADPGALAREAQARAQRGEPVSLTPDDLARVEDDEHTLMGCREEQARTSGALQHERSSLLAVDETDPAGLEIQLTGELGDIYRRHDRLQIVIALLRQAEDEYRAQHGPAFAAAASKHVARLTAGRYDLVDFRSGEQETWELVVRERGSDTMTRAAHPLSRGTREQIHVALRLALLEVLDGEVRLPVWLDEALVNWDSERSEAMLDVLTSLDGRQAFIATCHDETAAALASRGAHVVELASRSVVLVD